MKFNFHNIYEQNKPNTNTFLSRKHLLSKDINIDEFEDGLDLSDIEDKEENIKYSKNSKAYNNESFNDFSDDLDNFNKNECDSSVRKLSIESMDFDFHKTNKNKKIK